MREFLQCGSTPPKKKIKINMKKILLITSESIKLKSGGGLANRAFHDSLMRHFPGKVDVIQLKHGMSDVDVEHYYYVPPLCACARLFTMMCGHYHRLYAWIPSFLKEHGNEYSHCIINSSTYGDVIGFLNECGIKVATIHHNYEVNYQMDNKLPSTYGGRSSWMVRRNENLSVNKSALNMYLTRGDMKVISDTYDRSGKGTHVVIGMYEPEHADVLPVPDTQLDGNSLAVCGSLSGLQTENAIREMFDRYFDIIKNVVGNEMNLIIAGRDPGDYIKKMAAANEQVTLMPNPDNIYSVIAKAGIFLCPVSSGSGIKLRVMDGLRLGMPVLVHEVSAAGYENFWNEPWFQVYNDRASFMKGLDAIRSLIKVDADLRSVIVRKYREEFSFESGDKRFVKAITPFLDDRL